MVSGHAIVFDRLKHCRRCQKYEKYKSAEITKREWESYKHGHHDSCEFRKKKTKENQETTMDNFTARVKQARHMARKEALENDGRLVGDVQVTVHTYVPMGASARLLYTSDAADDLLRVYRGGRRIIQQKDKLMHPHT